MANGWDRSLRATRLDRARRRRERVGAVLFLLATLVGVLALAVLVYRILDQGLTWLSWDFLTGFPSRFAAKAGLLSALVGSLWVVVLTAVFALPIGVGAAIFLEEYATRNWLTRFIQTNILNLAGVPSIVYGLLGLTVFVRGLALGRSILAGALTMALLVLPIIIVATQEALRAVPPSLRHAAYALGGTRWQAVRHVVLPAAIPGILTGAILAVSRAIGESAPLIVIGALAFIAFLPAGPLDSFTVLPIQIFNWASRPQEDFRGVAAAGIIVLLAVLLSMNAAAIILRNRYQKRSEW